MYFPDENFRNYVSEYIDKDSNGILSTSEMESVTDLPVYGKNIASLKGIELFPNLQTLNCRDNQLTELDLTRNTALTSVICMNNQLTRLDISRCTELTDLDCRSNQLTELDVSRNTALYSLFCAANQLTALDLSWNTKLKFLNCQINNLTSLDLNNNGELSFLYCYGNPIRKLDVSFHSKLRNASGWYKDCRKYEDEGTYSFWYFNGTNSGGIAVALQTRLKYGSKEPPVISAQPRTVYASAGKEIVFSFTAGTPRGTTLTYQWYRHSTSTVGSSFEFLSGETGPTLTVTAGAETDGCDWVCRVSNEGGSVCTEPFSVKTITAPTITAQPKAASVKAGKKVTFKIKAAGEGLKYQWFYQKPKTTKWVKISGAAKATYSFTAKKTKNGYKYRCTVTNAAGSVTSRAVKLTVK